MPSPLPMLRARNPFARLPSGPALRLRVTNPMAATDLGGSPCARRL